VTHALVTPLMAIQGTIQFVRKNAALSTLDLPRLLLRMETAVAPGFGPGLYIAAAIVRRHGGTLEAARNSGGSVFTVRLPLVGSGHSTAVGPTERRAHGSRYQYAS